MAAKEAELGCGVPSPLMHLLRPQVEGFPRAWKCECRQRRRMAVPKDWRQARYGRVGITLCLHGRIHLLMRMVHLEEKDV